MRLGIVSFSRRKIGGTEQNLDVVIPEFESRGHQVQFLYFHDTPANRDPIRTGGATELVSILEIGKTRALQGLRRFRPDVINVHGEIDPAFQSELLSIAPSAYSVHNYYGTCISGLKSHKFPVIQPCARTFGPACLLHYFPRRCGGKNPVTMVQRYLVERRRLAVMSRYDAVIAHSSHMEAEYIRHGLHPTRVHGLPYEVTVNQPKLIPISTPAFADAEAVRLLYVGRMERLKGGHVLLDALPSVQANLRRPVELHFAGDGPERTRWEKLAGRLSRINPAVRIAFHGWQTGADLHRLFVSSHLLVVPSLWPEPFGKVGPEANSYGLPVAAFAVGGIMEWLIPGVNGMAAAANPPNASGLSHAITACLSDAAVYDRLRTGALASFKRFDPQTHVDRLIELFHMIRREPQVSAAACAVL